MTYLCIPAADLPTQNLWVLANLQLGPVRGRGRWLLRGRLWVRFPLVSMMQIHKLPTYYAPPRPPSPSDMSPTGYWLSEQRQNSSITKGARINVVRFAISGSCFFFFLLCRKEVSPLVIITPPPTPHARIKLAVVVSYSPRAVSVNRVDVGLRNVTPSLLSHKRAQQRKINEQIKVFFFFFFSKSHV